MWWWFNGGILPSLSEYDIAKVAKVIVDKEIIIDGMIIVKPHLAPITCAFHSLTLFCLEQYAYLFLLLCPKEGGGRTK